MGYNENYIEPWCQYFVECHPPALIDQGSKVGTRSRWTLDEHLLFQRRLRRDGVALMSKRTAEVKV